MTSAKNGREWSVWKASTNFHPMKFHEHVDTTYPKINYKSQLLTLQSTRDMAHTKPPNGSNSESRWGVRIRGSDSELELLPILNKPVSVQFS